MVIDFKPEQPSNILSTMSSENPHESGMIVAVSIVRYDGNTEGILNRPGNETFLIPEQPEKAPRLVTL